MSEERSSMSDLRALETPSLLVDKARMTRNITRLETHLGGFDVPLRPHVKTAKNIDIVKQVLAAQPGGITVSTLKEADYFLQHGITDIVYAVGITPNKLDHVAALRERGAELVLLLDSVAQAEMLATYGKARNMMLPALIEIDVDGHRAGVGASDPVLITIGDTLGNASHTELRGVLTHAGGSYDCRSPDAIRRMAARERDLTVFAAERLRAAGHPAPVVSIGSSPTAHFAQNLAGISEVRAGVYMFFDLVQAGLGVCAIDDIALSVLTSVIGRQTSKNRLIVDAGWMALSRDRGTAEQTIDQGYGVVCALDGTVIDELIVTGANQEHGIIARRDGAAFDLNAYPVGSLLRILPNHACATAAAHARYHVLDDAGKVAHIWERINGW